MPISAWVNIASGDGEPDWAPLAREYKACKCTFILHVASWSEFNPATNLVWKCIPYDSSQQPDDDRGVYAFALDASKHTSFDLPPISNVLYVGETGDSSSATLKTRLAKYRNIKSQRERPRVFNMLQTWKESLLFYFATVQHGISTKDCERSLLDSILPPANNKDFSAIVSNARNDALN